ncbi:MAG TPA: RNA methyltransferase [Terracidiphilus sp.]|jgi:TrmH family RNA methyltransferase|nr:RNA methyltransferase [Terracidiphilus sp.]
MPVRIVQSKQNSRLKDLRRALSSPARGEPVGIEGPHLLHEALRAHLHVHCVFVSDEAEVARQSQLLPAETEILFVPQDVLRSALTTETPQPLAALIDPPTWTWNSILGSAQSQPALIVLLAGLQDPGNLGTILRSAEAFGAHGVVCLPGTVSEWNSKTVRSSAGSVFRVPVLAEGPDEAFARLRAAGVEVLVAAADAPLPAERVRLSHSVALLIGNEGNGVPDDIARLADGAITIPCPGPVESLNAAVAASVLLYEASRQRMAAGLVRAQPEVPR